MKALIQPNTEVVSSLIEQTLEEFFTHSIEKSKAMSPRYTILWESLYALLQAGGKRIRPRIVFMAYHAFGGTNNRAIAPVAAAHELLHQSLLIHDDIIDRDYTRHSVLNIAGTYQELYRKSVQSEKDRIHYANSVALLAGDLLISGAYSLLLSSSIPDQQKTVLHQYMSEGIFEVAGGELLDLESAFGRTDTLVAKDIARYKTAGYSFIAPLLSGALAAGASEYELAQLRIFAESLGVAFQLTDDLLGVFGKESETGKSTTSDIREHKHTYMVEQFLHLANNSQKAEFTAIFKKPDISTKECGEIKRLLEESGAREAVVAEITQLEKEAEQALTNLQLDFKHHQQFQDLITLSLRRNA